MPPAGGRERCGDLSSAKKHLSNSKWSPKSHPQWGGLAALKALMPWRAEHFTRVMCGFFFPQGTRFKVDLSDFPHSLSGAKKVVYAGFWKKGGTESSAQLSGGLGGGEMCTADPRTGGVKMKKQQVMDGASKYLFELILTNPLAFGLDVRKASFSLSFSLCFFFFFF